MKAFVRILGLVLFQQREMNLNQGKQYIQEKISCLTAAWRSDKVFRAHENKLTKASKLAMEFIIIKQVPNTLAKAMKSENI